MNAMRALVVDDEPLARESLVKILETRPDAAVVDSASDAMSALETLHRESYDVILLDIGMPEMSGMEMLEQLKIGNHNLPAIIFVTAHSEHAVAAFANHAVDYVLKPFSEDRIHDAVDAALRRNQAERALQMMNASAITQASNSVRKIAIKAKGKILLIDPNEVMAARAEGNYVLLEKHGGSYLVRESISTLSDKLKPYGFVRIHRSALINVSYVQEIQPCLTGEYLLKLVGGEEFTVSRTYKKNLSAIADSWVGTDSFAISE